MSHPSKLDDFRSATESGFKCYLYFICTSSPIINIERVNLRVKKGGHPVPEDKIEERYYRSLELLKGEAKLSYRSFIWDNSGKQKQLIAEVEEGHKVTLHNNVVPAWVDKYLLS